MSWKETCPVTERMQFVLAFQKGEQTLSELCQCFGITRRTGYKWLDRFKQSGALGLQDASRAPRNHPNAVAPEIEERIVECAKYIQGMGRGSCCIFWRAGNPSGPGPAPARWERFSKTGD